MSVEEGFGKVAVACRALGLSRSSYYRRSRSSLESRRIRKEVLELSAEHPRYGYRRITALMRRDGFEVNAKRVARTRREEGIKVSKKQRRMKRLGISTAQRQRAERPRQVWSWDFVADQTEHGSSFRILTLLDEHTRQCLAIHPAWSIRAIDVITVVETAIARYGMPEHLRSDNGPEFIAYCIQDWLKAQEIKTLYIKPGALGRTGILRAFTTSCAMNALTANSSAICTRRALSWKAGVSNTTSVVRTARLAIRPRTSMPEERRTGLMGATRPQTPRRSPRQAFGGNSEATPQGGKQTKTKTLRNPQNFSYEVSHLRGHATTKSSRATGLM
jgi:putative transposase